MASKERTRQVVSGPFGPEEFSQRLAEGWKPLAIEWEREVPVAATGSRHTTAAPEVPFGLQVAGDCSHLEENPKEREVLFQIMELTIQDGPYSGIAEELNRRGYRTRQGKRWTPVSVFQMLPRLIEAGPGILSSEEWQQRRQHLKIAAK
jgi:Recombinase